MAASRTFGVLGGEELEGEATAGGAATFAPGEPNADSLEAIREGDAFLASGERGCFDNGADLVAEAMAQHALSAGC